MADKLKLATNIPEIIALEWTKGKEVDSQFGDPQIMFSLCDGRKWFAPPVVAAKVDALGLAKAEPFMVIKKESANGKSVLYDVARVNPVQPPVQQTQPLTPQRVEAPRSEITSQESTPNASQGSNSSVRQYTPLAQRYMLCFRDALDVANEVEKHAEKRGFTFTFEADDVRSMATTLFIETNKQAKQEAR